MEILKFFGTAILLLAIGDFIATFAYHVPEHVFGKYHAIVHHGTEHRSFVRYAIAKRCPWALVSGACGFFPYLAALPWLWQLSVAGSVVGLLLAEAHVLWRHASHPACATPPSVAALCQLCGITTPERHAQHHEDGRVAFGDIFAFYDRPARLWLQFLWDVKCRFEARKHSRDALGSYSRGQAN